MSNKNPKAPGNPYVILFNWIVACELPLRRGSRADRAVRVGLAKGSSFSEGTLQWLGRLV